MRKSLIVGATAAALLTTIPATPADAQAHHRTTKKKAIPGLDMYSFMNNGGPVGGYGGSPTATGITPTVMPAPPPTQSSTANAGPWPVGAWRPARVGCSGSSMPMRLRRNGDYQRASDSGNWRLGNGQIAFTYRDTKGAWGNQLATAEMERASPLVTKRLSITKTAPDRLTLAGVAWKRCAANPDWFAR